MRYLEYKSSNLFSPTIHEAIVLMDSALLVWDHRVSVRFRVASPLDLLVLTDIARVVVAHEEPVRFRHRSCPLGDFKGI